MKKDRLGENRMRITDLLDRRSISLDSAPSDKKEALDQIIDLMVKSGKINDSEGYRKQVYAREEESTTGIGEGIAIPHGKGTVHAKISGYYSSKQFFTGGQTVRQWLTGQSFQEQFDFGMDLLKQYGTVTPTDNGWIFTPF